MGRKRLVFVLAIALCACTASSGPGSRMVTLDGQGFRLAFDLDRGTFDVVLSDDTVALRNAFAEVEVGPPGAAEPVVFASTQPFLRQASVHGVADELGAGETAEIRLTDLAGAPALTLWLSVYHDRPFFTARLEAENDGAEPLLLARLAPAKVDSQQSGGLTIGVDPAEHRILEAGSFFIYDFFVDILPGDVPEPPEKTLFGMVHGYQRGHSISNWNHAIKDLRSGRSFVAGSLDFAHSSPMFNTSFDPTTAPPTGPQPFSYWSAEFPYLPNGKPLPAGEHIAAGPVWILPATDDPLGGLEAYADAVAAWNHIALWTARGAGRRVPTGWNSWTGSGSSGGYGSNINQQLMLDNLSAMVQEFKDFGGEWFQVDDGYQMAYGDWDWNPDRFPDGPAFLANQVAARGMLPGVWIAAFQVDENSRTYAQHKDDGWFAERLPFIGGDKQILDLTHPEVLAWLTERFRAIRAAGNHWVKTDFGYWALGAAHFHDPSATREEAYRRGLQAIQDGLAAGAEESGGQPGDVFWVNVSMAGLHVGFADSIRPNLDTMPDWDRESPDQGRMEAQGFKPTVRTIARRFYLQNRVYLFNHDMIFFRSHLDPTVPRLTAGESRCLLSAICLSGSVAKLGEKIVEMQPEWIDAYRRVIPVFGRSARPLDLFEREYPEIWHLRVDPTAGLGTGGGGPPYDVVALFNWGENADLSTNPYTVLPDGVAREISLDLPSIGLSDQETWLAEEFWSGEVIEGVTPTLRRTVAPHTVQVFALRKSEGRPQYLGGNRHMLQGAVEIKNLAWDPATATLSVRYDAAPGSAKSPFVHRLDFYVPAGFTLADASVPGAAPGSLSTSQDGRRLRVSFAVDARQEVDITLSFDAD